MDELRQHIIDLAGVYDGRFSGTPFVAGETYIPASGKYITFDEVAGMINVALDRNFNAANNLGISFGRMLTDFFQGHVRKTILCNSGSSANLLALTTITDKQFGSRAAQPGDEIITVAAGFPTTVNPIIQNGLMPVFVDVDLDTLVPDPQIIEQAVTEKTRGIILAHPIGFPFDAEAIRDICDEYHLWMIEDCCDALGSELNGRRVGTFGDLATLSLYPAHTITIGEGGAVMARSPMVIKVLESFRDWGRDCFIAGTKVDTYDGLKNIEDVRVGDYVVSHTGNYREVKSLTGKVDYYLVKIKPRNMKELVCTDNHPFLVENFGSGNFEFVPARDLSKGDYVLEKVPLLDDSYDKVFSYSYFTEYKTEKVSIDAEPDLMRLIGYWLAEGSLSSGLKGKSGYKENKYKYYRVDFTFSEDEVDLMSDVCGLMQTYFGVSGSFHPRNNSKGISIQFKSRKAYEFFYEFFGRGAKNKHLPSYMINWELGLLNELIIGYWLGDGSASSQGFSLHSISETMLNQFRKILLRYDIVGSFWERSPKNHTKSIIHNKTVESISPLHNISLYGINAKRFAKILRTDFSYKETSNRNNTLSFVKNGYAYYPIEKIDNIYEEHGVTVYNFEVEIDNSYHAEGVAVHNCYCLPSHDDTCGKRFQWQLGDLPEGYDHKFIYSRIGYNLNITEMQAALGIEQMKKIDFFIERRRHNTQRLYDGLKQYDTYFKLVKPIKGANPSLHGFPIIVKDYCSPFTRKDLVTYLEEHKIGTRLLFGGNIIRQPAYKDVSYKIFGELDNSDVIMNNLFWIGVWPGIDDQRVDYMLSVIEDFIREKCK